MVPLNVVMRYEFSNAVSQCIFTKENHLIPLASKPKFPPEIPGIDQTRQRDTIILNLAV